MADKTTDNTTESHSTLPDGARQKGSKSRQPPGNNACQRLLNPGPGLCPRPALEDNSRASLLVILNGWPRSGKTVIAETLSRDLDFWTAQVPTFRNIFAPSFDNTPPPSRVELKPIAPEPLKMRLETSHAILAGCFLSPVEKHSLYDDMQQYLTVLRGTKTICAVFNIELDQTRHLALNRQARATNTENLEVLRRYRRLCDYTDQDLAVASNQMRPFARGLGLRGGSATIHMRQGMHQGQVADAIKSHLGILRERLRFAAITLDL